MFSNLFFHIFQTKVIIKTFKVTVKTICRPRNLGNYRLVVGLISLLLLGESPEGENHGHKPVNGRNRQRMEKEGRLVLTASDQWVAGHAGDAALVVLVPGHQDVALVTPSLTPATQTHIRVNIRSCNVSVLPPNLTLMRSFLPVLDQPVVLTVVRAVAHNQDAVIQVLTAAMWLVIQA